MIHVEGLHHKESNGKELSRSIVLHEIWVAGDKPRVYLPIVFKPHPQLWWELPGGEIEGGAVNTIHVTNEAVREMREEVKLLGDVLAKSPPAVILGNDPLGGDADIVLDDGERKIISYPVMVREMYNEIPQVAIGPTKEHTAFKLLEITDLYSPTHFRRSLVQHEEIFGRLVASAMTGRQQKVRARVDRDNSDVLQLAPQYFEHNPIEEDIAFSAITAMILHRRVSNPRNTLQVPASFPQPK